MIKAILITLTATCIALAGIVSVSSITLDDYNKETRATLIDPLANTHRVVIDKW